MKTTKNIDYTLSSCEWNKLDLYLPDGECRALVLYLHGGGLVEGNRDLGVMTHFAEDMTECGIGVASAEYRLYPTAKYPDFIEDAAAAAAYAKLNLLPLAGCDKLFLVGTSAGGYLTQMLCFDEMWLGKHGISTCEIAGFVHDAGQPTVHFNVLAERGIDSRRIIIDESAPLYHVDKADYPPMQIIVSDNDMPGRLEQTELLVSALGHFGYDMRKLTYTKTHGTHVWYVNAVDGDGKNELAKLILPFIVKNI